MKVSYYKILSSRSALVNMLDEKLPPRAAYNIAKMVKFVNEVVAQDVDLYKEKVLRGLGLEPGTETVLNEISDQINEEMEAFIKEEIEVPVGQLKIADLGSNCQIAPADLLALDYLITD